MNKHTLIDKIVILAEEIEMTDPIDWADLSIDEHSAYELIANQVLENYLLTESEERDMMLLSLTVKLIVENFVLNTKLLRMMNE